MSAKQLSVAKEKLKFVLLEGIHSSAIESLNQDGYTQVETYPKALAGPALIDAIGDAHFVGLRLRTHLTPEVLKRATKLVAVGAFCIGTNQVDLDAAMMRGIPVFNAPFSNTRSVAELVLAEIVMLMRGIPRRTRFSSGRLDQDARPAPTRCAARRSGIVGYGHIGTQIGVLAEQLGMSVVFYDVETKLTLGNARQLPSLDAVLEQCRRGHPARAGNALPP